MSIASNESVGAEKLQVDACSKLPNVTLANFVLLLIPGKVLKLLGMSGEDKYAFE
jgi:hypothetical protein